MLTLVQKSKRLLFITFYAFISLSLFSGVAAGQAKRPAKAVHPQVSLHTSMGDIRVELFEDAAPLSVANFLAYAEDGFYDGLIFHRVVEYFMIQTGGIDQALQRREGREPIKNEANNGLKNLRGTVAMARYSDPDSATSQFFITVQDSPHLDPKEGKPGYAVFGRVISGMEVADAISAVPIETKGTFEHLPVETVVLTGVSIH